jgi:hypothetical protein
MKHGLAPAEAHGSDTYIPITEVEVSTIKERAASRLVHAGEIVEAEARQLARLLARHDDALRALALSGRRPDVGVRELVAFEQQRFTC